MPKRKVSIKKISRWLVPVSILLGLALWQTVVWAAKLPSYILPEPGQVALRFFEVLFGGRLLEHTAVTLLEVLLGLGLGTCTASVLGYGLARSLALEKLLSPYLVASQAIPVVAIAPLLIIWFGPGLFSKVLICALTVFFPVLVNTVVGVRAVPQNLRDMMQALRATPTQTLRHLELPAALPVLLGGLRIGATLSVIGAVVGELVGADRGLGFLINVARAQYDTALVFVAVLALVAMALLLYGIVLGLEKNLLAWNE